MLHNNCKLTRRASLTLSLFAYLEGTLKYPLIFFPFFLLLPVAGANKEACSHAGFPVDLSYIACYLPIMQYENITIIFEILSPSRTSRIAFMLLLFHIWQWIFYIHTDFTNKMRRFPQAHICFNNADIYFKNHIGVVFIIFYSEF